jgi:hypothetical protein
MESLIMPEERRSVKQELEKIRGAVQHARSCHKKIRSRS